MFSKKKTQENANPMVAKPISMNSKTDPAKKTPTEKSQKKKTVRKQYAEPADEILDLTAGMNPHPASILHRFSLRLQATVARKAIYWLGIYGCVSTLVIIFLVFFAIDTTRIIAVDANGRSYSIVAQRESDVRYSDSQVSNFASDVVFEAFDINFVNFNRRLDKLVNDRFTDAGKQAFMLAMQPMLDELRRTQGQFMIQSVEGMAADVVRRNSSNSLWEVRMPIILTLKPSQGSPITSRRSVLVTIQRVNDERTLQGILVTQVILANAE